MPNPNGKRSDEVWMRRAISLAGKGLSGASPNPYVGCVIVKNGIVLGEGYHSRFGGPHAEIQALRSAGHRSANATLYTNLEPCCHWGKTPPCTDAILRAGVRRVVSAMPDPNPRVRNKGLKKLKKAGIIVKNGVCERESRDLNRSFIKFMNEKKPYVILKSAISLDGKIATRSGESQWISSRASRSVSHTMRTQVDAVLVGAETVRRDNPSLTSHGKGRDPVRIVLTESGRLPEKSAVLDGQAPTWIFHGSRRGGKNRANVEWIRARAHGGKFNLKGLLRELARRGISRLLIEGGGETAAIALQSREIDEIVFFVAPILIGGKDAKTVFDGRGFGRLTQATRLHELTATRVGDDLMVNARIHH